MASTSTIRALLVLTILDTARSLMCDEALQSSDSMVWTEEDLSSMIPEEVDKCIAHLGKKPLAINLAKIIWDSLLKVYGGADNIPEDRLQLLHWVSIAIEPSEFSNITFDSIDIVENFGLFYNLNDEQLSAIAEKVREDWGGKGPEDYSYYDLIALKQILCAFNQSEVEKIHPSAYRDAATSLSSLRNCPSHVLRGLAKLAVDKKAYGPPVGWTAGVANSVGVVIDGLPPELYSQIPLEILNQVKIVLSKS